MKRSLESYLGLVYPFNVRPDPDDGGYIVEFPDLRYCVGTGETVEEAIADAEIAKSEWIKAAYEDHIAIPEPQSSVEYNGRISLRVPKSLHRNIIEQSNIDGVSANQFLNNLICIGMGKRIRNPKPAVFVKGTATSMLDHREMDVVAMTGGKKITGKKAGSIAKLLGQPATSETVRTVAGSDLSQVERPKKKK